jgi:hypothetical protein
LPALAPTSLHCLTTKVGAIEIDLFMEDVAPSSNTSSVELVGIRRLKEGVEVEAKKGTK